MEKRILAIDFGLKRIGIAVSDPLNFFASPLITLDNDENFWTELQKITDQKNISLIILGYPRKENGGETDATKHVEDFFALLKKKFEGEIILWDETYSSKIAGKIVLESGRRKKARREKKLIDKTAAAVILTEYLNSESRR